MINYIVDISKPPIPPPCRIFKDGLFGSKETNESVEQTKRWNLYIKEYSDSLKKR